MSEIDVRIVELEPLHVASVLGYGEGPEGLAAEKMMAFARAKGLLERRPRPRFFGFNNPSPSVGSGSYGYEIWAAVDPDVQAEGEVTIKDFPGGLYGVTRCKGVETIAPTWKKLCTWLEKGPYHISKHQWLEEHIDWIDLPIEAYVIDLYIPIKK